MTRQVRCAFCDWGDVTIPSGVKTGTGIMLQSTRFPTVFIHGTCRQKARQALEAGGFDWYDYPAFRELLGMPEADSESRPGRYQNQHREFTGRVKW